MKKASYRYPKVTYLGSKGSFTYVAAEKFFRGKCTMVPCQTIPEVFKKVEKTLCDYGVVPWENTTTGGIFDTFDMFLSSKLSIVGEIILQIHHQLLAIKKPGRKSDQLQQIRKCYSHPQAIAQCGGFFAKHHWIKPIFTTDTASGVKKVAQKKSANFAAIGGSKTAKIYNLSIVAKNIEDNKTNFTRFAVIGSKKKKEGNKISIVFSVKHIPGSLFKALAPYAKHDLNLTKIESRPVFGKPWEYTFFVDFEIDSKTKEVKKVLTAMRKVSFFVTLLGRYDKGKVYQS